MLGWHGILPYVLPPLAGGAAVFAALAAVSVAPRCRVWGDVVYRSGGDDPHAPRVALTFDDGPTEGATDAILDILADLEAPAAFFVVGRNVARAPHLVQRMHDEGHIVANHSFDHSHYGYFRGRRYWKRQIGQTDALIERLIGLRPALFRPPMGVKSWNIHGAAREAGHTIVTWSRRGWDGVRTTPQRICEHVVPHAQAGEVLMLHDGIEPYSRRDPGATVAAIRPLIDGLRARGLELTRLDRLIGVEPYARLPNLAVSCENATRVH